MITPINRKHLLIEQAELLRTCPINWNQLVESRAFTGTTFTNMELAACSNIDFGPTVCFNEAELGIIMRTDPNLLFDLHYRFESFMYSNNFEGCLYIIAQLANIKESAQSCLQNLAMCKL